MFFRRVVDDTPAAISLYLPSSNMTAAAACTWLLTSPHDVTTSPPVAESGFAAALKKLAQQRTTHVTSALSPYQMLHPSYQYSRGTREQQTTEFSVLQNAQNTQVDNNNVNSSSNRLKRLNTSNNYDDDTKPRSKKSRHDVREEMRTDVQHAVSPDRQSTCYTSCETVLPINCGLQARPRVLHRPFETSSSSSVDCDETDADTATDRHSSPADDDRRDVVSWSDCLRQLATSLRRRRDDNDDSDQVPTSTDVDQTTASRNQNLQDCRRRDLHDDAPRDHRLSLNNEDHHSSSSSSNNNNNNINKFETLTVDNGSVDDHQRSLSFTPAAVPSQLCRGTAKTSNSGCSESPPLNSAHDAHQLQRQTFFACLGLEHVSPCHCQSSPGSCADTSFANHTRSTSEPLQNAGHGSTPTLASLSQSAKEEETANLYNCWPGIDSVMLSYYQYELDRRCERRYLSQRLESLQQSHRQLSATAATLLRHKNELESTLVRLRTEGMECQATATSLTRTRLLLTADTPNTSSLLK